MGIRIRFTLATFLVGASVGTLFIVHQTQLAQRTMRDRFENSRTAIEETLSELCTARLVFGHIDELNNDLARIVLLQRFVTISVVDNQSRKALHLTNPHHAWLMRLSPQDQKDKMEVISVPLVDNGHRLGTLDIGLWTFGIHSDTRRILWNAFGLDVLLCLAIGAISWLVSQRIVQRLERLAQEVRSRDVHDYRPIEVDGRDEIASVSAGFNYLMERLQFTEKQRQQAEDRRADMTNMIIHDLKGPLAGFAGGVTMLQDNETLNQDKEARQLLGLMRRTTARLQRMIDSILQIARLENTNARLEMAPTPILPLIENALQESSLVAIGSGVHLSFEKGPQQNLMVQANGEIIRRVIDNLLLNALEHTPRDGTVTLSLIPHTTELRIEIRDNGPGIPSQDRERIFQKFQKGQAPSQGAGLGLAFCKLAVERHGGTIGVTEGPSGGALFYFTLPLSPATVALR